MVSVLYVQMGEQFAHSKTPETAAICFKWRLPGDGEFACFIQMCLRNLLQLTETPRADRSLILYLI